MKMRPIPYLPTGELDIKRFYLPTGIKIECPNCNDAIEVHSTYLNYPVMNKWKKQYFYCDECDTEFDKHLLLTVTIEIADSIEGWIEV